MGEMTRAVTVSCALVDVMTALTDMASFNRWLPSPWGRLEAITQTQVGKGARATFSTHALGMDIASEIEITEVGPELVRWSVALPPVEAILIWQLTEEGGATRVNLSASWRGRKLPPWRVRTLAKIKMGMDKDLTALVEPLPQALSAQLSAQPPAPPSPPTPQAEDAPGREGHVNGGLASALSPGQSTVVGRGEGAIAIFNIDGQFYAIKNDCPHRQGPLAQGQVEGTIVTCPLHRRRFDLKDGACLSHPTSPSEAFQVKVEGDRLWVVL